MATFLFGMWFGIAIAVLCIELTRRKARTWVDLTEEEIYAAIRSTRFPSTDITVSQSVIEAFKEKNK